MTCFLQHEASWMDTGAPVSSSGLVSSCFLCADSMITWTLPLWVVRDAASKPQVQMQQSTASACSHFAGKSPEGHSAWNGLDPLPISEPVLCPVIFAVVQCGNCPYSHFTAKQDWVPEKWVTSQGSILRKWQTRLLDPKVCAPSARGPKAEDK